MFLERTTGTLFTADLYSHCGIDVPPLADPATTLDRTNQLKFDFSDPRVPGYFEQLRGLKPRVLATMHGGAVNREVEKVMREWPEIHLGREWEKREMKEREARL